MSRAATITWSTILNVKDCPSCGITYAVPEDFDRRKRAEGGTWYCPNGHSVIYTKSDLVKAQERADALARDNERYRAQFVHEQDQRIAAERRVTAYKGTVTRMKKRTAAGVCPCCQRTFQQLARHMAGQHPDYDRSPS